MKIHPIQAALDKLEPSIINMAGEYIEGRNILIYCLARNSRRTQLEVLKWLKEEGIKIYKLDEFRIRDDSD